MPFLINEQNELMRWQNEPKSRDAAVPRQVKKLWSWAFHNPNLSTIVLPYHACEVPDDAFHECWSISNIVFTPEIIAERPLSGVRYPPWQMVVSERYGRLYCYHGSTPVSKIRLLVNSDNPGEEASFSTYLALLRLCMTQAADVEEYIRTLSPYIFAMGVVHRDVSFLKELLEGMPPTEPPLDQAIFLANRLGLYEEQTRLLEWKRQKGWDDPMNRFSL